MDLSVLKSGIEASYRFAQSALINSTDPKAKDEETRPEIFLRYMLGYLFNFLLLGQDDKYEFYNLLTVKLNHIIGN